MNNEKQEKSKDSDLSALVDELEAAYWVPLLKTPFKGLDTIEARSQVDCPELHQIFASFNSNLRAAKDLLEFPYLLLTPFLPELRPLLPKVRPSLLDDDVPLTEEDKMQMIDLVTATLKATKEPLMGRPRELQLLLHQACILIWSAVETFSKQTFIEAVNRRPSLYNKVVAVPELKERFALSNSTWTNLLQEHDFNLNGKLGTIIAANRDFSSPQLLKDLFPAMFKGLSSLGFGLDDNQWKAFWELGQRRHLIAHRCGVVDKEYMNKTSDECQQVGKLLQLRGRDLGEALGAAAGFAILLYGNARYCWRETKSSDD